MAGSRRSSTTARTTGSSTSSAGRAAATALGDPFDPVTEMGPLANRRQFDKVLGHLETARAESAEVVCGGASDAELGGYFVRPTVLTGLSPAATAVREVIFGPVLAVQTFSDEDEALKLANDTRYGLAGALWTKDVHRVAARLRAGTVWINAYRVVAPSVPFGGRGISGLGRENGLAAVEEYLETKSGRAQRGHPRPLHTGVTAGARVPAR